MNLLHIADLHIGKRVNEFSMTEDQAYVLKQIVKMVEDEDCHGILIAGDIYDKSLPSAEAVAMADEFLTGLAKTKKPVFIIAGNHDSPERIAYAKDLLRGQNIYLSGAFSGVLDKVTLEDEYGPLRVYMLPFVKAGQVKRYYPKEEIKSCEEALSLIFKNEKIDKSMRNILITHQFVAGGSLCESEEEYVGGLGGISWHIFDDFDYVALGHLHGSQSVGRESLRYSGSLLKYSFSEKNHRKGALKVKLGQKGQIEIEKKEFAFLHDLREIKGNFDELMKEDYSEDYMRILLMDERMPIDAIGSLRTRFPNIMQLSMEKGLGLKTEDLSLQKGVEDKGFLELFEDFYRMHSGKDGMEQEERRLLEKLYKEMVEGKV